jgi:hypothetical protein
MRAFFAPLVKEPVATVGASYESTYQPEVHSSFADTQEVPYASEMHDVTVVEPEPEPVIATPEPAVVSSAPISADSLSPEMINAIARRVVEMMSDKVVPDLAELIIKQQLEEKAK